MAAGPIFVGTAYLAALTINNAQGTTSAEAAAGGTVDLLLRQLLLANTSVSSYDLDVLLKSPAAVEYQIARVTVAANVGHVAGTPAVNLISSTYLPGVLEDPNQHMIIKAGWALQLKPVVTLTSGHEIHAVALGGTY